jgi:hypothetical protein
MPITNHTQYYAQTECENARCPKTRSMYHCSWCEVHSTATTAATAMTAAARLPTLWLEAPPVDSGTDDPVAEGDPAEPAEPAAPGVPVAR